MAISKVIYGDQTLIDLTQDTVRAEKLLKGYTAHGADGEVVTGSCDYDSNTQDATATDAEILSGKIAYVKGTKKTGTMKNNGAVMGKINVVGGSYSVPQGYHDGGGGVAIDPDEEAKIIPDNIRQGVEILGVRGTMSGSENVKAQAKEVTSSIVQQIVLPDAGYNSLTQVTVKPIPYVESDNSAGGKTVTIG